jgi:tRNA pseudouridine55 synthase
MSVSGLLVLDKPPGMTSRQAVNVVERLAKPARTGHAGTLDPLATGVLAVAVGAATRLIGYVQQMPKRYTGTFLLGRSSETEDLEGEVVELADARVPSEEQVRAAAAGFVGRIMQRPSAYSAIKIAGRRSYELARRGRPTELAARPIDIYGIDVISYRYPELVLDVACGSGTYIRALGRDLAESLGTAAVMSALRRTAIGNYRIESAIDPRELGEETWRERLLPEITAVERLPRIELSPSEVRRIQTGLRIVRSDLAAIAAGTEVVAVNSTGTLVGILTPDSEGNLRTVRNMPT